MTIKAEISRPFSKAGEPTKVVELSCLPVVGDYICDSHRIPYKITHIVHLISFPHNDAANLRIIVEEEPSNIA
jgi:hypothetical protein